MTPSKQIAAKFHPGEFVKEEMEYRGWTIEGLAIVSGLPTHMITGVIDENRMIDHRISGGLGKAFGTGPQFWRNLQRAYDKWSPE